MGMFSGIMQKLGFSHPAQPTPTAVLASADTQSTPPPTGPVLQTPLPGVPTQPAPITFVDVMGQLERLAAANPQKLNWKESIVDMLKLLGLDFSLAARKQLATELGCPAEKMTDSAQMNIWLHQTVLQQLAKNGGNVPKELLH